MIAVTWAVFSHLAGEVAQGRLEGRHGEDAGGLHGVDQLAPPDGQLLPAEVEQFLLAAGVWTTLVSVGHQLENLRCPELRLLRHADRVQLDELHHPLGHRHVLHDRPPAFEIALDLGTTNLARRSTYVRTATMARVCTYPIREPAWPVLFERVKSMMSWSAV